MLRRKHARVKAPVSGKNTQSVNVKIYFSDFFNLAPEVIGTYGAFNVSLVNDLPLFIDPFLLFNSEKPEYQALHKEIIKYVKFLRDKSIGSELDEGSMYAWYIFK